MDMKHIIQVQREEDVKLRRSASDVCNRMQLAMMMSQQFAPRRVALQGSSSNQNLATFCVTQLWLVAVVGFKNIPTLSIQMRFRQWNALCVSQ